MAVSWRIKFLTVVISIPCADGAAPSRFVHVLLLFRATRCAARLELVSLTHFANASSLGKSTPELQKICL